MTLNFKQKGEEKLIITGRCKKCGLNFRDYYNMTGRTIECPFCHAEQDIDFELVVPRKATFRIIDLVDSEFNPRNIYKYSILNQHQVSNNPIFAQC